MRTTARRMALGAFSALAATTLFTAPAHATVFNQGISVQSEAHIAEDGGITLSGTYHCEAASLGGAVQIKATVIQDGSQLSIGAGEVVCDGAEHEWVAHSPITGSVHPGRATAVASLQEIHLQGLFPRSVDTVAQDTQDIEVVADHR
ncbi:DUF6299 family protein [Streptomyces sp. NBC_00091]|uniref:DUF6299 family protein n=1 Tax=Streptomyces sp. NBC_00091 TaxID=2975648 RepID=UPI0022560070|nr:DUF6299 family protein [Streptomyces sp. NBC_00091]MCX5377861.1 DUF6299 family protein [Streptomyces sp. NBC_00091]